MGHRRTSGLALVTLAVLTLPVVARPLTAGRFVRAADDPEAYLVDGHYLRGETRIARMRRAGELPDRVRDGRCTYELAGDPGVVYYARTCR